MDSFKARVACDLHGSKHNAMFLFKPPPMSLAEIITEVQKFYQAEAEARKPAWHNGPAFHVSALQMFDKEAGVWVDVTSVAQLEDGCQLYAFQQPTPPPPLPAVPPPPVVYQDPLVRAAQLEAEAAAAAAAAAAAVIPSPVPVAGSPAAAASPEVAAFQYLNPSHVAAKPQKPKRVIPDDGTREGYAFNALDTQGDGVITLDEMIEGFQYLGLRFTPAQVQDLFIVADENGDSQVTREEFSKFALRFPTVVDCIHEKKHDDEMLEQEAQVLKEAEAALQSEQDAERKLLEEAAGASKRVRDLMAQIADHKLNHEAQLQRRPVVEAQQQQLVEQELALAAQKERLRLVQENIRKDIENQLRQVSQSIGRRPADAPAAAAAPGLPAASVAAETATESAPPAEDDIRAPSTREPSGSGASTASFFLMSETAGLGKAPSVALFAPASVIPAAIDVGGEVEACNFESKPEFNGLRGKVTAMMEDGRVTVQMFIRNGLTLDMLPNNVRGVVPASSPSLNEEVVARGSGKCLASNQHVDLSGCKGRVVGLRAGVYLCEFRSRAGIFELIPDCLRAVTASKPKAPTPASSAPPPSAPVSVPQVSAATAAAAPTLEDDLAKARTEAAVLRAELAQERARAAVIRSDVSPTHALHPGGVHSPSSNNEVAAALARLGNLSQASPLGALAHTPPLETQAAVSTLCSPLQAPPPVLPPARPAPVLSAATDAYTSLPFVPATTEPKPSLTAALQTYALGPIDPSSL